MLRLMIQRGDINVIDYTTKVENELYNQADKNKFIAETFGQDSKIAQTYIATFKAFSKYERLYEKDLLNWSRSMLISVFENMQLAPSSFDERLRQIKSYYLYYNKEAPKIKFEELDSHWMHEKYFGDFKQLQDFVSLVFDSEVDSLGDMRKACLYLLYLGFNKKQIPEIRKSDIDDSHTIIKGLNPEIEIPQEIISHLRKCKSMTTYYLQNSKYRFNYSIRELSDSDYLIRGDSEKSESGKISEVFIKKIFDGDELKTDNKSPTQVTLRESGLFQYVYLKEKQIQILSLLDFKSLVSQYAADLIDKRGYLYDKYIAWKKAFK